MLTPPARLRRGASASFRNAGHPGPANGLWLALALTLGPCSHALADNVGGAVSLSSSLIDRGISIAPDKATLQMAGYWLPSPGWSVSVSGALQAPSLSDPVAVAAQIGRAWMLGDRWQTVSYTHLTLPTILLV